MFFVVQVACKEHVGGRDTSTDLVVVDDDDDDDRNGDLRVAETDDNVFLPLPE